MAFPWVAKIFLAIFSDNISCCGSRRKSYLIVNSAINILSIIMLIVWGI
jgi:BT1 family